MARGHGPRGPGACGYPSYEGPARPRDRGTGDQTQDNRTREQERVGAPGFEPGTSASRTQRSTGLSHAPTGDQNHQEEGEKAGDRIRTGDLNLGKVALFQLSYTRKPPRLTGCYCFDDTGAPVSAAQREHQSHRSDLNRRPLDYESSALPLSYGGGNGAGGI